MRGIIYKLQPILVILSVCGLFLSGLTPLPLSISIILLGISCLIPTSSDHHYFQKVSVLFCSGVILALLWLINSQNHLYFWERIQIRMPLLVLGLCCSMLTINRLTFSRIIWIFVLLTTFVSAGVLIHYLWHADSITASYLKSKVLPTPINHIRYSIIVAFGCYCSYYLLRQHYHNTPLQKILLVFCCVFLFVFAHILAVRSGLIILYCITAYVLAFQLKPQLKPIHTLLISASILIVSTLFYFSFGTLKNKIHNTIKDIKTYQTDGYQNNHSISTRLISYKIAWELFKSNKISGVGLGDIKDETDALFKRDYPEITIPILPHNQFLFALASTGITGLVLFLLTFFGPLFINGYYKNEFLCVHYLVLFVAFQFEPMLETQLGMGYSVIFLIIGFSQSRNLTDHKVS